MEKHGNALRYELAAAILPSRLAANRNGAAGGGQGARGGVPPTGRALYVGAAARPVSNPWRSS